MMLNEEVAISLIEYISSLVLIQQNFIVTIQEHNGTDSICTFGLKVLLQITEQCAYMHICDRA